MADTITASVQISTPTGWLELNDVTNYELAKETFADRAVSKKLVQASNQFLEGAFTIHSLREQVNETISVYVRGNSHFDFQVKLRVLTDAFDQPTYRIVKQVENSWEVWFAGSANYRIETGVEMLHATMAKITIEVPRHPVAQLTNSAPT